MVTLRRTKPRVTSLLPVRCRVSRFGCVVSDALHVVRRACAGTVKLGMQVCVSVVAARLDELCETDDASQPAHAPIFWNTGDSDTEDSDDSEDGTSVNGSGSGGRASRRRPGPQHTCGTVQSLAWVPPSVMSRVLWACSVDTPTRRRFVVRCVEAATAAAESCCGLSSRCVPCHATCAGTCRRRYARLLNLARAVVPLTLLPCVYTAHVTPDVDS